MQTDMNDALGLPATVNVNGKDITVFGFKFPELSEALGEYAILLSGVAISEDVITDEIILREFPIALAANYSDEKLGKPFVIKFLKRVTSLEEEDLNNCTLDDITTLWEVIYKKNHVPFASKLKDLILTGALVQLKETALASFKSSQESELTQETKV